jgi:ABC-type glycerol-3-phosphate transport system substrate-binding protein
VAHRRILEIVLLCLAVSGPGCGDESASPTPIRFLHTFNPDETELFNATIAERGLAVDSSLVPFARGQQVISEILASRADCPDLIRIDATWLPGLRTQLVPVPADLAALDWTPEAAGLGQLEGAWWGVPQAVDGLLVIRDSASPAPASPSIADLVDGPDAARALATFADVFGDVAAPPPPSGSEAPDELRRWNTHEVAYWITGPWQLGALRDPERVAVTALARAPRGGQLLVVPACAKHPDQGWRLAAEIASIPVAVKLAQAFSTVPTRTSALASAPPLARAAYEALRAAEMLPRVPVTPLLFDDLNPALAAVVARDATAEEAIEGVRRGWRRLVGAR